MARVKRGTTIKKRHKKLLSATKGYRHGRKNLVRLSRQAQLKAGTFAYRDRKVKKRTYRSLWIVRINGALKPYGIKYSEFIKKLKDHKIDLNRKVLSELASQHPDEFKKIVNRIR